MPMHSKTHDDPVSIVTNNAASYIIFYMYQQKSNVVMDSVVLLGRFPLYWYISISGTYILLI